MRDVDVKEGTLHVLFMFTASKVDSDSTGILGRAGWLKVDAKLAHFGQLNTIK